MRWLSSMKSGKWLAVSRPTQQRHQQVKPSAPYRHSSESWNPASLGKP